jgi:hypothetical protein
MGNHTVTEARTGYAKPKLSVYGEFSKLTSSGSRPVIEDFTGPPGQAAMNRL